MVLLCVLSAVLGGGLARPDVEFQVYQFPKDQIPRIDGNSNDWSIVPASFAIGSDQLRETVNDTKHHDSKDLEVTVKVGWVKGLNRLYFLYEAYDDYWDFEHKDLHNDIFEVVVDGDLSGGPLIRYMHPNESLRNGMRGHLLFHGVHAQNYHIFTPARHKDWAMVWGCQPWIKDLPYANAAYHYDFEPGESGKLTLEFYITPFDYAPADPSRAVATELRENQRIGLSWAILDYDDRDKSNYDGFWNLSHETTMYGDASQLVAFRLMPLEEKLRPAVQASWSFVITDFARRQVAFRAHSYGNIQKWHWDFGDGTTSDERHPHHQYTRGGEFVVTLSVEGPDGTDQRTKVWDVTLP